MSGLVHFVSLGCPKNRVDAEIMLGHLQDATFDFTPEATEADVIVVNTCGFIEAAKQESIDAILQMARLKETGRLKKLIVSGCLVQRYASELADGIPEIDHLLGNGEYTTVAQLASGAEGHVARDGHALVLVGRSEEEEQKPDDGGTAGSGRRRKTLGEGGGDDDHDADDCPICMEELSSSEEGTTGAGVVWCRCSIQCWQQA